MKTVTCQPTGPYSSGEIQDARTGARFRFKRGEALVLPEDLFAELKERGEVAALDTITKQKKEK